MHVVEAGGCIAVAPKRFDALVKFTGLKAVTSFEDHVLEEVGDPRLPGGLHSTAGAAPKVKADHRCIRQIELHQGRSVGELTTLRFRQRSGVQT